MGGAVVYHNNTHGQIGLAPIRVVVRVHARQEVPPNVVKKHLPVIRPLRDSCWPRPFKRHGTHEGVPDVQQLGVDNPDTRATQAPAPGSTVVSQLLACLVDVNKIAKVVFGNDSREPRLIDDGTIDVEKTHCFVRIASISERPPESCIAGEFPGAPVQGPAKLVDVARWPLLDQLGQLLYVIITENPEMFAHVVARRGSPAIHPDKPVVQELTARRDVRVLMIVISKSTWGSGVQVSP